jgi:hypothetical protein
MIKQTDYTKIISIITTLLLCAGIVSKTVYYFFFNVPITEFLSISEVLLLFTQDIIRYVLIFIIIFLIVTIFNYDKQKSDEKRFFIEYCQIETLKKRIWRYLKKRFTTLVYYIFGILIFFTLLKDGSKVIYLFGLYFSIDILYFIIRFIIFENKRKLRLKKQLKKEKRNLELSLTFGLHFLFFVICWSLVDVQKVKYEHKYINVSFTLSDTLIKSDSSKYYIGQTEKYLFYYNSITDITTAFKKDNIKEINFGKINYIQFDAKK